MKIEDSISILKLSEKCEELLHENRKLKEEIRVLKARLVIVEARKSGGEIPGKESEFEIIVPLTLRVSPQGMSKNAEEGEKSNCLCRFSKNGTMFTPEDGKTRKKGRLGILPPV